MVRCLHIWEDSNRSVNILLWPYQIGEHPNKYSPHPNGFPTTQSNVLVDYKPIGQGSSLVHAGRVCVFFGSSYLMKACAQENQNFFLNRYKNNGYFARNK